MSSSESILTQCIVLIPRFRLHKETQYILYQLKVVCVLWNYLNKTSLNNMIKKLFSQISWISWLRVLSRLENSDSDNESKSH